MPTILKTGDDLDLRKIAESGQCFRWTPAGDNAWRILSAGECVRVTALGEGSFLFDCDETDFRAVWAPYFDLGEDYRTIRTRILRDADPFLRAAAERERGIRILRQDPWETLITFILSQNRNIPAIRRSVELLCEMCGERKTDARGEAYFAFPAPEAVAALEERDLKACRTGYRWAYVRAAAEAVLGGEICLEALREMPCDACVRRLTALRGVGGKVAACVALFGLHQLDAFPRDVWINRILAAEYPDGYPFARFSPWNGVCQQYMFAYCIHRERGAAGERP